MVASERATFAGCISPRVLRSYTLQPRGARVGIDFSAPRGARISVDVFQHTLGHQIVLRAIRVAHFTPRRGFVWNGRADLPGRRVADGIYSIRIVARRGRKSDTRELTLIRARGRFARRVGFFRPASCDNLRLFTLEQPAFGGAANTPLRIDYALRRAAPVLVQVFRGPRLVATFRDGIRAAGRTWRHRIAARRHAPGDYKVFITIGTPPGTLRTSLVSRRL